ncbi:hypothetical protein [Wolbachia endosymbiont (group A) of Anthophora plumipes]|uniref:hypothetical protein n=1 Tax=Wolbachia endosymbiont (group A) of Anthophora plumipes TaxID=3066194 RepID=UPI0029C1E68E|nr:hypothetical protein [Wolbachia endosymbiont of Nomada marshamella]
MPRHWDPAFDRKCCIVCLFTVNFSESQCLGTGMTPFIVSSHLLYDYLFRALCLPILPLC